LDVGFLDGEGLGGLLDHSLGGDPFSFLIGLSFQLVICLYSLHKGFSAGGKAEMFHSHVDFLLHDSIPDLLVHDHTNGARVNIEHFPSSPMIQLIGHTFMNGTIHCNIHDVSNLESG
jgi:hypothetical protein